MKKNFLFSFAEYPATCCGNEGDKENNPSEALSLAERRRVFGFGRIPLKIPRGLPRGASFLLIFVLSAIFAANLASAAKGVIKTGNSGGITDSITITDLGIENPGTLPTSRLYFLKEWRRGIARIFTFNSIAKAELELKITNEKAAEALKVKADNLLDAPEALAKALENYTKAGERLQTRLAKLKETSENPNVEKLLEKLNEQTFKHAIVFNQLIEKRNTDPSSENNHLQDAVDIVQKKIKEIVVTAVEKEKNIEQKAKEQIARADIAIHELTSALAEFAINEPGVSNNKSKGTKRETGGVEGERFDCPKDCLCFPSANTSSPNYWQGQEIFCTRENTAKDHLENAEKAFSEGKYGEAFGQARSAEVLARNGLRIISKESSDLKDTLKTQIKEVAPITPNTDTSEKGKRVFPETNNRTTCDDREAKPACPRGEILDCHGGKWVCIGQATGRGINAQTPAATTGQKQIEIKPTIEQTPVVREKTVTYNDTGYSPSTLSIKKGETVIFKNQSSRSMWTASAMHPTHRVYSDTSLDEHCPDPSDIAFDACTGTLPNGSWTFRFDKAGTWKYHDHLNPTNYGAIVVE